MNKDRITYTKNGKTKSIHGTKNELDEIFYPANTNINGYRNEYELLPGVSYLYIKNVEFLPNTILSCNKNTNLILENCTFINGELTIGGGKILIINPTFKNDTMDTRQNVWIVDSEEITIYLDKDTDVTYILDAKKIKIHGNNKKVHEIISEHNNIINFNNIIYKNHKSLKEHKNKVLEKK